VSVESGVAVGVKVLVNNGRSVLVGVGVTPDILPPPMAQLAKSSASNTTRMDKNRVRLFMQQRSSQRV